MDNFTARNLQIRDLVLLYNDITESCFSSCVNQLGDRDITQNESRCVDVCFRKHINVNDKVMQVFVEVQPQIVNKRIEEMKKQEEANAAKTKEVNAQNGAVS